MKFIVLVKHHSTNFVAKDGDDAIIFNIWDFAGQEEYYCTHQFFLSSFALFIVVVDVSAKIDPKWRERLNFWLYSVRVQAPNAPIFLVGTHTDKMQKGTVITAIVMLTIISRQREY